MIIIILIVVVVFFALSRQPKDERYTGKAKLLYKLNDGSFFCEFTKGDNSFYAVYTDGPSYLKVGDTVDAVSCGRYYKITRVIDTASFREDQAIDEIFGQKPYV